MSSQLIRVFAPAQTAMPRGAQWAADAMLWLTQHIGRPIWRALEGVGQRRAARDLRQMAQRYEAFDATMARTLREASRFDTRN